MAVSNDSQWRGAHHEGSSQGKTRPPYLSVHLYAVLHMSNEDVVLLETKTSELFLMVIDINE